MLSNRRDILFEVSTLTKVIRAGAIGGALSGAFGSIVNNIALSPFMGGGFGCFSTTVFTALTDGIETGKNVKPNPANEAKIYGGVVGGAIGGVVGYVTQSPSIGAATGAVVGGSFSAVYYTGISFFSKNNVNTNASQEVVQEQTKRISYN